LIRVSTSIIINILTMYLLNYIYNYLESIKKFPKRHTRKNISNKPIEGFCLGEVNYRGQKYLNYKTRGPSKYNEIYAELLDMLNNLIKNHDSDFTYTTIQINKNVVSPPHVDKNNIGMSYIIAFGDYEDGELVIEGTKYDIKNKFLKFDGNLAHWTEPFRGTRYSIIYFTHTFKPPSASFRNIQVTKTGLYLDDKLVKVFPPHR